MTPKRQISTALAAITLLAGTAACDASSNAQPMPSASSVVPTLPPSQVSATTAPPTQFAAAEAVYRTVSAEQIRLFKAGGIPKGQPAPKTLSDAATGDALAWIMGSLNQVAALKLHNLSGTSTITAIQEAPVPEQHSGSTITLHSCEDGRSLVSQTPDGKKSHGNLSLVVSSYKPVNGRLVMVYYNDDSTVAKCPIA